MKHCKRLAALLSAAAMLLHTGGILPRNTANAAESVIYNNVRGLPFANGDPVKGVDVSSVIALEDSGVVFRNRSGEPQDIFQTLAEAGVNTVRLRIWNDPFTADGQMYGGGVCDSYYACKIAKRCADAGLKLFVDLHYSDFWADPGKQRAPKAWEHLSADQKAQEIYFYTGSILKSLQSQGAEIAMVQIGNETTTGMCGVMLDDYSWSDEGWRTLASLFNSGSLAVRHTCPDALVVLHFTNPEKSSNMAYLAQKLNECKVDYDVFATSYYPYWHGTLSNLKSVLGDIAKKYGKKVLVAETSWVRTLDDGDCFGNTISSRDKMGSYVNYEVSVGGQCSFLHDLFATVASVQGGIGVCYWEPAWLPVGTDYESNLAKWERYGSGWATKAAGEYDKSAAQYFGGSAVDNESLFSADGIPLDSLYMFGTVHGSKTPAKDERNLVRNPGFEVSGGQTETPDGWSLTRTADGHFDVRAEDSRTGAYALHWYAEQPFTGSTAVQQITVPANGVYQCTFAVQGDAGSVWELTAVTSGGAEKRVSGKCTGWAQWQTPSAAIRAAEGETLTLTLSVSGGAGSYGSADDFLVYRDESAVSGPPDIHLAQDRVTMRRGERFRIRCDGEQLSFRSDREEIAAVDGSGEITAHGTGTAVITVYAGGEPAGAVTVTVTELPGDIDADGALTAADAKALRDHLTTAALLGEDAAPRADMDANGRLDARDLTLLKRAILEANRG